MLNIAELRAGYPGRANAVDGLSLVVLPGENVALIGANGAGKTTLMLAVAGVLQAEGGTIAVDGILLEKKTLNEIRARVGLVFQNPDDQLFMPSVFDDIAFGPRNYGLAEAEVREKAEEVMARLGISHLGGRSALRLSGGEKRTAAIATVLAMEPSLLLFDEPTAFLDLKARRTLIRLLGPMPQAKLIASHDLPFLLETCKRAVLMKDGKIFADGPTEALLRDRPLMEACDLEAL